MKKHLIDITVASETVTTAKGHIDSLRASLTFLLSLQEDERKRLRRLGLRNETFSLGAIEVARNHPQVIPAGIDMAAIERDITAREQLLPLLRDLQSFTRLLEDTVILLGCDIYEGGRTVYKSMKLVGDLYGLSEIIAELGLRYARKSSTGTAPATESVSTAG